MVYCMYYTMSCTIPVQYMYTIPSNTDCEHSTSHFLVVDALQYRVAV